MNRSLLAHKKYIIWGLAIAMWLCAVPLIVFGIYKAVWLIGVSSEIKSAILIVLGILVLLFDAAIRKIKHNRRSNFIAIK